MTETRPWGSYTILNTHINQDVKYKIKRIEVLPLQRLSLQSHNHRSEHWTIVSGEGLVQLDNTQIKVTKESYINIKKGQLHRIQNTSSTQILIFIEIQIGEYLEEDDIIRYEDDYNRIN